MNTHIEAYKGDNELYGIRNEQTGQILVEPTYEWIGSLHRTYTWVKRPEGYGLIDSRTCEELIPCQYRTQPSINAYNQIIVWHNQKAGLIDPRNHTLIPIEYDFLILYQQRYYLAEKDNQFYWFNLKAQPIPETKELAEIMHPDNSDEQEEELYQLPLVDLEQLIRDTYHKYQETHSQEDHDTALRLIQIRQHRMNEHWQHNATNAERLSRVNDLLNLTVKKALALAQRTAQSLAWMRDEKNDGYIVEVGVYPHWTNQSSEEGYRPLLSGEKEQERLDEQKWNNSEDHIWNIIRYFGGNQREGTHDNMCFSASGDDPNPETWDFDLHTMNDGQSWDEGIHRPIYEHILFLHPWHRLFWDDFNYALEDLARMNEFRITLNVHFEKALHTNEYATENTITESSHAHN